MVISLKQAIEENKLNQFIAEHPEVKGDMDAFNRTVETMARKSEPVRQTSSRDDGGD